MSVENVEIVQALWQAFQVAVTSGDVGAWFDSDLLAPDAELVPGDQLVGMGTGTLRGPEGVRKFMRVWTENFEHWSIQLEGVPYSSDDRVVALFRQSASGKGSGVPVENQFALLYELDAGRVIRMRLYADSAEAVDDARRDRPDRGS